MNARFIGGPLHGQYKQVPDGLHHVQAPIFESLKFHESSSNLKQTLEIKVAIYELYHVIIDGEECDAFILKQ